mmetsp:Transcript_912/g.2592  ORF Transcript_912/g.2592 Transcript_912/m.2592 type:complete len:293 (-) Transcript_912:346-1224(-)
MLRGGWSVDGAICGCGRSSSGSTVSRWSWWKRSSGRLRPDCGCHDIATIGNWSWAWLWHCSRWSFWHCSRWSFWHYSGWSLWYYSGWSFWYNSSGGLWYNSSGGLFYRCLGRFWQRGGIWQGCCGSFRKATTGPTPTYFGRYWNLGRGSLTLDSTVDCIIFRSCRSGGCHFLGLRRSGLLYRSDRGVSHLLHVVTGFVHIDIVVLIDCGQIGRQEDQITNRGSFRQFIFVALVNLIQSSLDRLTSLLIRQGRWFSSFFPELLLLLLVQSSGQSRSRSVLIVICRGGMQWKRK